MKIQLIRTIDDWYKEKEQLYELESFPSNLALLASTARDKAEVEIIDGIGMSTKEIIDLIDADIVGVTDIFCSHESAKAVLKGAKNKGAKTIIGGQYVTHLAKRILKNNDYIDMAVRGDGEAVLPMLVDSLPLKEIPNLFFKDQGKVVDKPMINSSLDTLYDLENIKNPSSHPYRISSISAIRGCIKAEKQGRCTFCSVDHKLKLMKPETAWKQVDLLNKMYGAAYFWEVGDSFMVENYPEKFLAARPDHLSHTEWRLFLSPDQLNERNVKTLKELNARYVLVGSETSNNAFIEKSNKSFNRDDVFRSIDLLTENEILFQLPFLYGFPGETEETAEANYQFAKQVIAKCPDMQISANHIIPFPGTEIFRDFQNHSIASKEYSGNLSRDDDFDFKELVQLHVNHFTDVDFEYLEEVRRKTQDLAKEGNRTSFAIPD
ncbi:B12-binding domain-containing radical SAM protein [Thermoproteota archaeon]